MRCCIGDGGAGYGRRSSAAALQGEAANHRKVRRSRAGVLSVCGKVAPRARQVMAKKASASDLMKTCIKGPCMTSKPGLSARPGMSLAEACRLARRCPAWRWRELGPGSGAERVNLSSRARGRPVAQAVARGRARKGDPQAADPRGAEYRCGAQGRTVS